MLILVKTLSLVIIGMGVMCMLSPQKVKGVIRFWAEGRRVYIAGFLRILFGIIFLLAASQCRVVTIIVVIGILFLIGGIAIFTLGPARIRPVLNWWQQRSDMTFRLLSLLIIFIGTLILYSV